ncbi:hypothetical protein D3C87_75500 [compost metagenome]
MKAFQAEISYHFIKRLENGHLVDRTDLIIDTTKYGTREQAQAVVDATVSDLKKRYEVYYGKVTEVETEDKIMMEGVVSSNPHALILQIDENIQKVIESEIKANFYGRKVRVTVELIE